MISRAALIAFIAWQALWLNVVLPGHTRGAITLPGAADRSGADVSCDAEAAHACCSAPASRDDAGDGPRVPTPGERARCAICYFATGLSIPPAVELAPTPLGTIALLPVPAPDLAPASDFPPTYRGRAPPTA